MMTMDERVDLIVLGDGLVDRMQIERRRRVTVVGAGPRSGSHPRKTRSSASWTGSATMDRSPTASGALCLASSALPWIAWT